VRKGLIDQVEEAVKDREPTVRERLGQRDVFQHSISAWYHPVDTLAQFLHALPLAVLRL
jgi:hypothetical protein